MNALTRSIHDKHSPSKDKTRSLMANKIGMNSFISQANRLTSPLKIPEDQSVISNKRKERNISFQNFQTINSESSNLEKLEPQPKNSISNSINSKAANMALSLAARPNDHQSIFNQKEKKDERNTSKMNRFETNSNNYKVDDRIMQIFGNGIPRVDKMKSFIISPFGPKPLINIGNNKYNPKRPQNKPSFKQRNMSKIEQVNSRSSIMNQLRSTNITVLSKTTITNNTKSKHLNSEIGKNVFKSPPKILISDRQNHENKKINESEIRPLQKRYKKLSRNKMPLPCSQSPNEILSRTYVLSPKLK